MDNMMQMAQIRNDALHAEADAHRLAKLAQEGQEPRRANPALSILQMVLVMLK